MKRGEKAERIGKLLDELYPLPPIPLRHRDPFTLLVSVVLGLYRYRFSPLWPLLLYYNQVVGAFVKTYVSCRLNQQKWIRQNITAGEPADERQARRQRRVSNVLYVMQGATFVLALAFYTKVLPIPAASSFRLITGSASPRDRTDPGQRPVCGFFPYCRRWRPDQRVSNV